MIVFHLDSGAYYSLRESGCAVWEHLLQHVNTPDAVQVVAARYAGASDTIQAGVATLIAELLKEQPLVSAEEATQPGRTR